MEVQVAPWTLWNSKEFNRWNSMEPQAAPVILWNSMEFGVETVTTQVDAGSFRVDTGAMGDSCATRRDSGAIRFDVIRVGPGFEILKLRI